MEGAFEKQLLLLCAIDKAGERPRCLGRLGKRDKPEAEAFIYEKREAAQGHAGARGVARQ